MQTRELNCATSEAANNRDTSGSATANEMKLGLGTGKGRGSLGRSTRLKALGSPIADSLFGSVASVPARVDKDEGRVHREIEALQATVASLQLTVSALQNQVNTLQAGNSTPQSELAAIQSNHALLLGPFVIIDPNPERGVVGPNIIFRGANIHIVSGSGATGDRNCRWSPTASIHLLMLRTSLRLLSTITQLIEGKSAGLFVISSRECPIKWCQWHKRFARGC
jgi:hypothetical protein